MQLTYLLKNINSIKAEIRHKDSMRESAIMHEGLDLEDGEIPKHSKKIISRKTNLKGYNVKQRPSSKESNDADTPKQKLLDNYVKSKRKKLEKLKVEIDLPWTDETQLRYSLLTNSSDGKKIIYLKKKDRSKERSMDPDDALQKYVDECEIHPQLKKVKKAPIKNAKAFLTQNPKKPHKETKWESQNSHKIPHETISIMQRFSSVTSKPKDNILEIETLKSTSKESRSKKTNSKKKCKKKSNLVNYLGKNQTAKLKMQSRTYKSKEKSEFSRPHTAQDYLIKPPSNSSKKSKAVKPRFWDSGNRYIKSSKSRMTSDLVNLINQTKKDVESLKAFRRSTKSGMKSTSKKTNYLSPLADRGKEDAYGLSTTNKNTICDLKADKSKCKKKRIANVSASSRKNKVKTKQDIYQPISGTIDLVSRNERWVTQNSNEHPVKVERLNSRKSSPKRTNSIESSEHSEKNSKNRFLVSKKYNKRMEPLKRSMYKEGPNSLLERSAKFGTNSSISKYQSNQTHVLNVQTPSSTASQKMNLKGSLIARKCMGYSRLKHTANDVDTKPKKRRKPKEIKPAKDSSKKQNYLYDSKPMSAKTSKYSGGSKLNNRGSTIGGVSLSTSKRIESQITQSDLYNQILKNRKDR